MTEKKYQGGKGMRILAENLFSQYGLQVAKYIIPFLTLPYLARVLGADAYAIRAYVLSLMTFVQVFLDCGFNLSATKEVVTLRSNKKAVGKLVGDVLLAKFFLIAIGAAATFVITLALPILRANVLYVVLAYSAVAFNCLCPDFVFIGYEKMMPLTTRYVVSKLLCLVLTFLLIKSPKDLLLVPALDVLTSCVALVWTWVGMRKRFGVQCIFSNFKDAFGTLKDSLLYFVSNASSSVHNSFLTLVIGVAVTNQAEIAYWSVMLTAISAVQSLYSPIGSALYPHMLTRKDTSLIRKLTAIALPVLTLGCAAFALLANVVLFILGGDEYVIAAPLLQVLTPVLWFSFFGMLYGWPVLGAFDKVKEMTISTAFGAAFVIVSSLLLLFCHLLTIRTAVIVRVISEAIVCVMRSFHALPLISKRANS